MLLRFFDAKQDRAVSSDHAETRKAAGGLVTTVPIILAGYLAIRFINIVFGVLDGGGGVNGSQLRETFFELIGIQLTAVGILVALLAFYLWHLLVVEAGRNKGTNVSLWVLALVFFPIIAMPVYWLTNVWPEAGAEHARRPQERDPRRRQ